MSAREETDYASREEPDYELEEFLREMDEIAMRDNPANSQRQFNSTPANIQPQDPDDVQRLERIHANFESDENSTYGHQKRKEHPTSANGSSKKQPKLEEKKAPENRAVYVTNIPRDATFEEINEIFAKYGIIDQGVEGNPRIKMYADESGDFNGEALIVYFKKESVALAINMMDEYEFRLGDHSNGTVRVQAADMSFKKHTDGNVVASKLQRKDRKAAERNRANLNRKLTEWSESEEEAAETFAPKKNKWAKMAIIKRAFQLAHLKDDDTAIMEIKEDMRGAAEKYGDVTKVVLYDKEPQGIVSVRFKTFESAEAFAKAYHGRRYNKNNLDITIAEDRPKFKKSKNQGNASDTEDDAARYERYLNDNDSD